MNAIHPDSPRCEYFTNPLGIDIREPRLSWKLRVDTARRGVVQTAFQVLAARSREALEADRGDLWDSGKIESDACIHIRYAGVPLRSRERAWWKVCVWDETGSVSRWSEAAFFEMGLLSREEWLGDWIGSPLVGGPHTSSPAPYLRRSFPIDRSRKIKEVRLHVTALGLYEFYLNGHRVGNEVFRPGWTDYTKRIQYDVHDVTSLVKSGENVAGAILGAGWYCGQIEWRSRQLYGDRPRLLAQLAVEFDDGSAQYLLTDGSWKTAPGPILEDDLVMGETYDARLEMPGWNDAGFDDAAWWPVKTFADPGVKFSGRSGPPVRRVQELKAKALNPGSFGKGRNWIFDLGQNMVGRVKIRVRGKAGETLKLRFAEVLDKDGNLYLENLRGARATDYYTLRGGCEETWEPRFTFHGFRYVEVRTAVDPFTLDDDAITGVVLHSDTRFTGEFECSDPLVNQLQRNIQWGQRGNFLEVPTDCPQRDERMGWTGDAQVFIRTAAFNADVAGFFTKWQNDIADAQSEDGAIPCVIPGTRNFSEIFEPFSHDGGPAWADAAIVCPWTIYLCYGDKQLLAGHYGSLQRFVEYLEKTSRGFVRRLDDQGNAYGFGDWVALDGSGKKEGGTPKELIGTAFFAYSTRLLGRIAHALGHDEDAEKYEALFIKIRSAFQREFVSPGGRVAGGTQTSYVLALHFDLLDEEVRAHAANELVRDIQSRGMHLSTGFVGTPYLPHVLTRAGRLDIAYGLLMQKSCPSFLYPVTQGATTIWERWDGWTPDHGFQDPGMNSFNHYAYGAIGEWLYSSVAGIDADAGEPGYKRIIFRPKPGGGLTSARASLDSMHGKIESDWKYEDGGVSWHIVVPPNTHATVFVPETFGSRIEENGRPAHEADGVKFLRRDEDAAVYELGSGDYSFRILRE